MPRTIAINGTQLDKVFMPIEPSGGSVRSVGYPSTQFKLSRSDQSLRLNIPVILALQLYRARILPQDSTPVEVSINRRSAGRYTISDLQCTDTAGLLNNRVTLTLTRVAQEVVHPATKVRKRSKSNASSGTYVTDITHYLDDTGELASPLPPPARKLASFLTLLIDATTGASSDDDHDSGIRCRQKDCRGSIRTSLVSDEIHWRCPTCRHNGVIRNWRNTKWNQLKHTEPSQ